MSIIYNTFDFATSAMTKYTLPVSDFTSMLPPNQKCKIYTNIKYHCGDESRDFVINIANKKVTNPEVFDRINEYLEKNKSRSYHFEGFVSNGNGNYSFYWSS